MSQSSSSPTIIGVEEIDLFHPATGAEESLKRIDFQGFDGANIANHKAVEERIDEGWVPRGVKMKVRHESVKYDVIVSGNEKMGYVKLEDIGNVDKAKELQDIMRSRFLEFFRLNR